MSNCSPAASRRRSTAWSRATTERVLAAEAGLGRLAPATVYRFVLGVDSEPVVMPPAQFDGLGDPMGLLLRQGRLPLTLNDLLAEVDATGSLPVQKSYLAGETGQISPADAGSLQRDLRFVITRAQAADVRLLVSTSAVAAQLGESDRRAASAARIEDYITAIHGRISTAEGFADYVRLAESRRREFKRLRLNEFALTLPVTNIPLDAPLLQMNEDGTVSEKPHQ